MVSTLRSAEKMMEHDRTQTSTLPDLPLVLSNTPLGLTQILEQEGVPFVVWESDHDDRSVRAGRFVIWDHRLGPNPSKRSGSIQGDHQLIDLADLGIGLDRWNALLNYRPCLASWEFDGVVVREKIAAVDRHAFRTEVLAQLRRRIIEHGGIWARIAPFPYPYRAAFNFRVDLDEPVRTDYARFAVARRPLNDCTSHCVSTSAYGTDPEVLADLRGRDVLSHGHHHVVYRDEADNRRNLDRADAILRGAGIVPEGFAGPHGRWDHGIDHVLESLGYRFASDFQVGYDDLPFRPAVGSRLSERFQIPITPICAGIFHEAGVRSDKRIVSTYRELARRRIEAGRPAFLYGHPERRLVHHPRVFGELDRLLDDYPDTWRVTLSEFARWWRWRNELDWSLQNLGDNRVRIQFTGDIATYQATVEIPTDASMSNAIRVPISRPVMMVDRQQLRRTPLPSSAIEPAPTTVPIAWNGRSALKNWLDWETETPINELPTRGVRNRLKRWLRSRREAVC